MTCNADFHHRCSIRLKDYDYASTGAYFVAVCVQERECLFGGISNGAMMLNNAGRMVEKVWHELSERFSNVATSESIVMPNHFHGIILFNECRGEPRVRPDEEIKKKGDHKDLPYGTLDFSLGRVIQAFKSLSTLEYVRGVECLNWPPFPRRLWQRNLLRTGHPQRG